MVLADMVNITLMQGFAGLGLFAVLLLMGLGLAIIFGQMGVINMAHGEFMAIGAYTVYMVSRLVEGHAPDLRASYFPVAIALAFCSAFAVGWLLEWALIRHLYKRPLDTLLATWGVSLALQQCFRTFVSPKEVSPASRLCRQALCDRQCFLQRNLGWQHAVDQTGQVSLSGGDGRAKKQPLRCLAATDEVLQ